METTYTDPAGGAPEYKKLQASDIFSFANVYLFRSEHDRNKIFLSLENGASVTPGEYPETGGNNF